MIKILLLLFFLSNALLSDTIKLEISHMKNQKGYLLIALFTKSGDYPKKGWIKRGLIKHINAKVMKYTFKDIEKGTYAISIVHDENKNLDMDTNFIGMPKEGFGFSTNPKIRFSAPSFNDTKFYLNGLKNLSIKMDYL